MFSTQTEAVENEIASDTERSWQTHRQKGFLMPITYTKQPREIVISIAAALKNASEQLMQVASQMETHGLEEGYFRWSQRQWDCLDVVTQLCSQSVAMMPHQVLAKNQNRPCCYEAIQKRSARDVAARKLRTPASEPKKPGRRQKAVANA